MQTLSKIATDAIPIEVLRDEITHICGAFEIEPARPRGPSHGMARGQKMGGIEAAFVSLDAQEVVRTRSCIQRDPGEYYFMLVQDVGECTVHQNGAATLLRPGDMYLVDATRPSRFVYDGKLAHQISLHLPRDEMLGRFGDVCEGGLSFDRTDPLWLALRAVLYKMTQDPDGASPQLGEAFYGLMGAYFHERRTKKVDPRGQIVERALHLIARHYRDPEFGPARLASELGVSLRSLQRYFEPLGETPGQRLLQLRLERAHADLTAGRGRDRSIADCAYACGFNDLSHFYRAFRQHYGTTPGAVVAQGRTGGAIDQ